MGPSGSGKSSLLTVLAGRSTATASGTILFGGQALNKAIKRKMGYVSQDDLLYAELTVRVLGAGFGNRVGEQGSGTGFRDGVRQQGEGRRILLSLAGTTCCTRSSR